MTEDEQDRVQQLLKAAMPRSAGHAERELRRDLWPEMLKRLEGAPIDVPWFDWALLGAVAVCLLFSPAAIPLLLFYL
jgi:hypothetical protein